MLMCLPVEVNRPQFAEGFFWMVLGAEDGVPNPECQGAARVVRPLEKALVMTGFLAGPIVPRELWKQFMNIARNLYRAYIESDATLAEINPLIIDGSGNLLAVDG